MRSKTDLNHDLGCRTDFVSKINEADQEYVHGGFAQIRPRRCRRSNFAEPVISLYHQHLQPSASIFQQCEVDGVVYMGSHAIKNS